MLMNGIVHHQPDSPKLHALAQRRAPHQVRSVHVVEDRQQTEPAHDVPVQLPCDGFLQLDMILFGLQGQA